MTLRVPGEPLLRPEQSDVLRFDLNYGNRASVTTI
jgi:hypothetical protein